MKHLCDGDDTRVTAVYQDSLGKPVLECLSLRFNGHFPGEPGLAGVYWSKEWWKR